VAYNQSRRNELAKALGYKNYSAQRKAPKAEVTRRRVNLTEVNEGSTRGKSGKRLHRLTSKGTARARAVIRGDLTRQVRMPPASNQVVLSQLSKAADDDYQVKVRVVFAQAKKWGKSGGLNRAVHHEVNLFPHGGWSAGALLTMILVPGAGSDRTPGDVRQALETLANSLPDVVGASGVELAIFDLYDAEAARQARDLGAESLAEVKHAPTKKKRAKKKPAKRATKKKTAGKRAATKKATTKKAAKRTTTKRVASPSALDLVSDVIDEAVAIITGPLETE
jgi:hypothetical protein